MQEPPATNFDYGEDEEWGCSMLITNGCRPVCTDWLVAKREKQRVKHLHPSPDVSTVSLDIPDWTCRTHNPPFQKLRGDIFFPLTIPARSTALDVPTLCHKRPRLNLSYPPFQKRCGDSFSLPVPGMGWNTWEGYPCFTESYYEWAFIHLKASHF